MGVVPRRVVRVTRPPQGVEARRLAAGLADLRADLGVAAEFPPEVLQEAEESAQGPALPALDRTDLAFVTIDPESARDLDQALHLEPRPGGGWRVHYAIADVAAFVRPGGLVDHEAHRRGETLYGVGEKVPLHPPALSERAASLLPDGPRPALLWTLDVDSSGEGVAVRVERAMVRSRAKLSYEQVQRDLDAGTADPMFGLLRDLGKAREARERARGGVSLPLPDQEVEPVEEHGRTRWHLRFRDPLPVEGWNAQVSLLTGMGAAYLMVQGGTGLLRTLAPADPRDVDRLHRVARALHVPWPDDVAYPDFIRSLDAGRPDHAAMLNASTTLLRGSGYVAFRDGVPEASVHSALAGEYAHVTAPLRRLVDRYAGEIAVALTAGHDVPGWVGERLEELPATMQASTRRANAYERGVLDLVEAALLEDRVGEEFAAMVVSTERKDPSRGEVVLDEPAVEARARTADGGPLPLGTAVRVRLARADVEARKVEFVLAEA